MYKRNYDYTYLCWNTDLLLLTLLVVGNIRKCTSARQSHTMKEATIFLMAS